VWKPEKNGHFSVKSAYRLCVEEIVDNSHLWKNGYWGGIWKLKVPPKVKSMVWRVCKECLPTRVKLNRRGVTGPSTCVLCNDPHEDSYHIFFHCCTTVGVWHTAGLWHLIEPLLNKFDDAPEIIFHILEHTATTQEELFATTLWSIWKRRNHTLWQQVTESNRNGVERATHLLEGWRHANIKQLPRTTPVEEAAAVTRKHGSAASSSSNKIHKWQKPRRGRLKCNIDASFSMTENKLGIGICIRNEEGRFIRAKTMWFSPVCSVDVGEALGLFYAIRWVHELRLQNVDFEVDSKRVADYFNRSNRDITEFGNIMDSNIHYCHSNLENSHVEFIRRQANAVAHELAKASTSLTSFRIFDDVPTCIHDLIFNEMLQGYCSQKNKKKIHKRGNSNI